MKNHAVIFTAKEKAEFLEEKFDAELHGDEIIVKDDYDLISAGTELANFRAMPNTSPHTKGFPSIVGYSASGHVVAVGPEAKLVKVDDRVTVNWGKHRAYFKRPETQVVKIPDGVDMQCAAYAQIDTGIAIKHRRLYAPRELPDAGGAPSADRDRRTGDDRRAGAAGAVRGAVCAPRWGVPGLGVRLFARTPRTGEAPRRGFRPRPARR